MSTRKTGEVLDGKYELLGRLGSGGMGEVYKVRHVHLEEFRVIKILRQDLATDPAAAQRFLYEARTATSIKHPNLAILYDFSKLADGSFYMVWENIEGEDLSRLLRERGPLPLHLAIELGIQALQGLDALHTAGVIHRDISPDNVMITRTPKGQPLLKIIDLGLAKSLDQNPNLEITQAGMFLGKLRYCSPEQAGRGGETQALDRRSDIYSCAAVFYEAICGLPPFDSESPHGFVLKRLTEDPLPLSGRNPKILVPDELDAVIRRGLERDREQRFPDAQTFIRALQRVAERIRGASTVEVRLPSAKSPGAPRPIARPSLPDLDKLVSESRAAANRPTSASTAASGAQTKMPLPSPSSMGRPNTGELSRAERVDLMAQIERAARRVEESSGQLQQAADAMKVGRVEEARELVEQMKSTNARQKGLADVEAQVLEAESKLERVRQAKRTEEMLESYLKAGQPQLARFALETLLEVAPDHPRAAELERRVSGLSGQVQEKKLVQEVLQSGRGALLKGDIREARRQLAELTRLDKGGELTKGFEAEIAQADRERQRSSSADTHRQRIEEFLRTGQLDLAAQELDELARLGGAKVTIDLYRQRIGEAHRELEEERQAVELENRARAKAAAGDFAAAREIALEFERQQPASLRPGALFGEINQLLEDARKRQGIDQGVRQLEGYLASNRLAEAELAFKILIQMAPQHPRRQELESAIRTLRATPR